MRLTVVGPFETYRSRSAHVERKDARGRCRSAPRRALRVNTSKHQPTRMEPLCWKAYAVPFTVTERLKLRLLSTPPAPGSGQVPFRTSLRRRDSPKQRN